MKLVNFAHPLSPAQVSQAQALVGARIDEVVDVPTAFDPGEPFAAQVDRLLGNPTLGSTDWEQDRIVVNLPSFAPITAILLARLHGLSGHFPPMLRLARGDAAGSPYYVREVIDLQSARDEARGLRRLRRLQ